MWNTNTSVSVVCRLKFKGKRQCYWRLQTDTSVKKVGRLKYKYKRQCGWPSDEQMRASAWLAV